MSLCGELRFAACHMCEKWRAEKCANFRHRHTRLPAYPFTRSLLTLNLKFTARHSYISRRQTRPRLDRERARGRGELAFAYLAGSRSVSGLGLNALGPVHWRLVRCCKPEFLSATNQHTISIYLFLSVWSNQPTCLIKIFVMPLVEQVYLHICCISYMYCLPFDECAIKYYAAGLEY